MHRFKRFAARDAVITVAATLFWWLEPHARSSGGGAAVAAGVLAGLGAGLFAAIAHEWGHLSGALLTGAPVSPAPKLTSPFMFRFDTKKSSRRQFLAMSYGGFIASALVIFAYLKWLPLDALSGRIALAFVALGLLATITLEVPVVWQVHRGAPLPTGAIYQAE